MKVYPVQQQNFNYKSKQKTRFINDNIRASITSLLLRMNGHVETVSHGDYNEITFLKKLKMDEPNISFEDKRHLTQKVPYKEQMQGYSAINLGKRIFLEINNATGEIINYKKPFYYTWRGLNKKVSNALIDMRGLFGLDEEVKKETQTVIETVSKNRM